MQQKAEGSVTVFGAFMFILVCSVLFAQFHSTVYYMNRADVRRASHLAVESFLAEYCRPLRDGYGILAVDGGYGKKKLQMERIRNDLRDTFERNSGRSSMGLQVGEPVLTMLIEDDWALFQREISMNMEENVPEEDVRGIMEQWELFKGQTADGMKEPEESQTVQGAEREPSKAVLDPRQILNDLWGKGILAAACPETFQFSSAACSMDDVSFPHQGRFVETSLNFKKISDLHQVFEQWDREWDFNGMLSRPEEERKLFGFIFNRFRNALPDASDADKLNGVLQYEVEYILAGNESDLDNLKSVLWKILALRSILNMEHVLTSTEKKIQTAETAAALASAFMVPYLTHVIDHLLQFTWAFSEGLADCRCLLNGGRVPVFKDEASWHLSWNQMLSLTSDQLNGSVGQSGLSYKEYMSLFLMLTDRETIYQRMTNLMEKNIRLQPGYENFSMTNSIYGIQTEFECHASGGQPLTMRSALSY